MKLRSLTICGFRSFGAEAQTMPFTGALAVVFGANSKGKSSLVEAVEFLLTGRTTRSQLHPGAKVEFTNCLRNVHLDPAASTWVEASIQRADATSFVLRRELRGDIDAQGNLTSRLSLDGVEIAHARDAGITLAAAPFEAPVLMQHALRFVLATEPKNRADYIKMVLEIGDLDGVRERVANAIKAMPPPSSPAQQALEVCISEPAFVGYLKDGPRTSQAISARLTVLLRALTEERDESVSIAGLAERLRAELTSRRTAVFPMQPFVGSAPVAFVVTELAALPNIAAGAAAPPSASPGVLEVLRAVRKLPSNDGAGDCPVCLTPQALSSARLSDIDAFLRAHDKAGQVVRDARDEISGLSTSSRRARANLKGVPPSTVWTDDDLSRSAAAAALVHPHGATLVSTLASHAELVREPAKALTSALDAFDDTIRQTDGAFTSGKFAEIDVGAVRTAIANVGAVTSTLATALHQYEAASQHARRELTESQVSRSNTSGWDKLLNLANLAPALDKEASARAAWELFTRDTNAAMRQIEAARKRVLDENFSDLSGDVGRWWELLRAEEPIRFAELRRRGEGHRFIDLKATIEKELGEGGVERDAVGVFSESQLNALGLAMFLARALRSSSTFVLLDDPVPSSDEEHRHTFASSVIGALLTAGVQVIVTTHDKTLRQAIETLHAHAGMSCFAIELDQPANGSRIRETSDELARMLHDADNAARHLPESSLRRAAVDMRVTAERLCKEIVVAHRRAAGDQITVADVNGATLKELADKAVVFLTKDPSHPGKLRHAAQVLNPGAHDDTKQFSRAELTTVMGNLKKFAKDYR